MAVTINKKKVIVVEGKNEIKFFEALLEYMEIADYEIYDVKGKNNFKNEIPALVRTTGFSDVEVFAVIRDADNDANSAFESIKNILKKQGLKPPTKMNQFSRATDKPIVGIYIMPGNSDTGMLEDLCLRTVEKHPAMICVNSFINCVKELNEPPRNLSKAKAQAFLAAMPEIVNSVGIGAKKGYWDFDSEKLNDLKSFLKFMK